MGEGGGGVLEATSFFFSSVFSGSLSWKTQGNSSCLLLSLSAPPAVSVRDEEKVHLSAFTLGA